MCHWREAVGIIINFFTSEEPSWWRENWRRVGEHFSYPDEHWRNAIRAWADSYGIPPNGWRSDIHHLQLLIVGRDTNGWREDLCLLACELSGGVLPPPIEWRFILDSEPQQAHFRYRWIASGIWDADAVWRA